MEEHGRGDRFFRQILHLDPDCLLHVDAFDADVLLVSVIADLKPGLQLALVALRLGAGRFLPLVARFVSQDSQAFPLPTSTNLDM